MTPDLSAGAPARRLVLINGLRRETSEDLYEDLAARVRARGVDVVLIHGLDQSRPRLGDGDLIVSNISLPSDLRASVRAVAGRAMARPISLKLLEDAGVPTMAWTLAANRREIHALFATWSVERLLLKPSFTHGGKGVRVFTKGWVWLIRWNRALDVFCREVNPEDGDVYKAELFNGRLTISWMSKAPPLRALFRRGVHRGVRGAYGERSLCELPATLVERLCAFSRSLTAQGIGYVSVDLMRQPDGTLVSIELNPRDVATWWTRQFSDFRERYASALYDLVVSPAGAGDETQARLEPDGPGSVSA
jgi:hypothetical protein